MKRIVYLTLLLATSLCACSPLELSMQLTATQVASEIFGTQTATAPTSTITFTPSLTLTPGPTRTITPPPTLTKRPTATPPPTVTLDADEVERMILCYKAAVVVWADYNAYIQIIDNRHGYSDDLSRDLATLTNERRSRVSAIIVDTKDKYGLPQTIIKVNGTELTRRDCAAVNQNIILANFQIDHFGPWGVGSRVEYYKIAAEYAVQKLTNNLETVYSVDSARLDAIEAPIWQHVHNRYGVDIP